MIRLSGTMFALAAFAEICSCSGPPIVAGPPQTVAKSAANAWVSAGHTCELKGDLAYCDMSTALPFIVGYAGNKLLFATVFDTQSIFGRACDAVQFDQVMRPVWMTAKCDEIALADGAKKIVLSIIGGGPLSPRGLSRDELVRTANLFLEEAAQFLVRLKDFLALAR